MGSNVAANVQRIREARRLSTRQLSTRLAEVGRPIPASGITRIEQGMRRVDVDDLAALAKTLDVQVAQLLLSPSDLSIEIRIGSGGEGR
ncbi:helix-turn-helix domain-containing protein [Streptomyces prasinopilosus]|uniref:helix-turn-helix domain-containing protein n=1 Tax=Streptomyces prasinopilosus TaxID=67344 RepID=UPI001F0A9333|nr:helix-turn-helix transcriptional regulator [Streptomyces prasinopilosus]